MTNLCIALAVLTGVLVLATVVSASTASMAATATTAVTAATAAAAAAWGGHGLLVAVIATVLSAGSAVATGRALVQLLDLREERFISGYNAWQKSGGYAGAKA